MVNDMSTNTYWEQETLIAEVVKNETSKFVINRCIPKRKSEASPQAKPVITIREWYCTKYNPTWLPAKSGITLPQGDIARLAINALLEANK